MDSLFQHTVSHCINGLLVYAVIAEQPTTWLVANRPVDATIAACNTGYFARASLHVRLGAIANDALLEPWHYGGLVGA